VEDLDSKSGGAQARAVQGLLRLGAPAVPYLADALGRASTTIAAREAIVAGLGRMGPAAKAALPHLDRLIQAGPPVPGLDDSPEEIRRKNREANLVTAMQQAAMKIRGR
jgi:hypothetical protein